jgi:phosphotransferase system HPr (HPr) family protein
MSEQKLVTQRSLHARPASLLADLAAGFDCEVKLEAGGRSANAKSVLSLMALDLEVGDEVLVWADGDGDEVAASAVAAMLGVPEGQDD